MAYSRKSHIVECRVCSKVFETKSYKAKFCSQSCKMKDFVIRKGKEYFDKYYLKANRIKSCPTCDKQFVDPTSNNLKKYCNRKCDINYRIGKNLRSRLNSALKNRNIGLTKNIGCSISELRKHLESKFKPGMTWENYGRTGWHIDHIIPLCAFDLSKEIEFKEACHFSNLQPLWAAENMSKNGKY